VIHLWQLFVWQRFVSIFSTKLLALILIRKKCPFFQVFLYFLFPLFIGSGGFCPIGNSIYFIITVESYITSTKIKPNWHVMTGSRSNRYRYNHIRASTRPDFSTKSTRYIRLLVITGLVIYDFYWVVFFGHRRCKPARSEISFGTYFQWIFTRLRKTRPSKILPRWCDFFTELVTSE